MPASFHRNWITGPAANVKESKENFVIELAVPGRDKEDFSIRTEGKNLVISYEKAEKSETENEKFSRREFKLSSFSRTFLLPEVVDKESIGASYNNGILSITLPKKDEAMRENNKEIRVK
ncbi:MAG: Hsp20/alpha crystallin family protein [Crocinitomicaceae bacterium]|nr:Hsp20/alpha crystallin family protein [Crocinitomicaceae bacterium]